MENLLLAENIKRKIFARCLEDYPKEACGILAGEDNKAEVLYPLENISDSPQMCYEIETRKQLAIQKELRAKSLEMVAIYHSHTNSEAYPSAKDLELAYYPDSFYLIVSLINKDNPEIRAFKIKENDIKEANIIG